MSLRWMMVGSITTLAAVSCAPPPKEARSAALTAAIADVKTPAATVNDEVKVEPEAIPTACAAEESIKGTKACLPPATFAKKLCGGLYPEVALGMFAKGTPWTRMWLAGDVEAWNASGGLTQRTKLAFDEEILVLERHGAASMMTGAQASLDVLRWDGSCVSLLEGELTTRRPPMPRPAPMRWSRLEETTQRALLGSPKVKATRDVREKACSSVLSSAEKRSCDKAETAFIQAVGDYVRGGVSLPPPARRP